MTNINAQPAAKSSITVDPSRVLARVDDELLLIKDRTKHGLHRRVIARKGCLPNAEWVRAVSIHDNVELERIKHWYAQQDEYWLLWIFWKEVVK